MGEPDKEDRVIDLEKPLHIRQVRIVGAKRTKPSVFDDELQSAYRAKTTQGVLQSLRAAGLGLEKLSIFHKVDIGLDKAEGGKPDEADVIITVKEKGWFGGANFGVNTELHEDDSIRAETSGSLINITGRADSIRATASRNLGEESSRCITYTIPRIFHSDVRFELDGKDHVADHLLTSSFKERSRGIWATLRGGNGRHQLTYQLCRRDVAPARCESVPFAHTSSLSVAAQARPDLKSSITYTRTEDMRNNPYVPTAGAYMRSQVEVAGIGMGDVSFLKGRVELQKHIPLIDIKNLFGLHPDLPPLPISLALCCSAGGLRPWGGDNTAESSEKIPKFGMNINSRSKSRICDRFFLGGPMMFRGFKFAGVGPRAPKEEGGVPGGDSLGGDIITTASAALSFPLPIGPLLPLGLRAQVFTNVGNLIPWGDPLSSVYTTGRATAGVGLIGTFFGFGRFELTYSAPIRKAYRDQVKGVQFGVSLNFL